GFLSYLDQAVSKAALPICFHCLFASQAFSRAESNDLTLGASATNPDMPSCTHSALPPTSVTTEGRPHNIASINAMGAPSSLDGSARTSFCAQIDSTSSMNPMNSTRLLIP